MTYSVGLHIVFKYSSSRSLLGQPQRGPQSYREVQVDHCLLEASITLAYAVGSVSLISRGFHRYDVCRRSWCVSGHVQCRRRCIYLVVGGGIDDTAVAPTT